MKALLMCQPIPGHVHPNLALAAELTARGCSCTIYTGARAVPAFEREGLRTVAFHPGMDEFLSEILLPATGSSEMARLVDEPLAMLNRRNLNRVLSNWLLATIPYQMEDLEKIRQEFQPDVVVSDPTLLGPVLLAKDLMPTPVVVYSVLLGCSIPSADAPPFGRGLPSDPGPVGRLGHKVQKVVSDWMLRPLLAEAQALRARYGLPPIAGRIVEEYARTTLFLVPSSPSFDYGRTDLPDNVRYIGACPWDGGKGPETPGWIQDLETSPPVVHVTEGTIFTREPHVLKTAVAAFSELDLQVNMSTGRHRAPESLDLGEIGPNIRLEQFVPHRQLFPKCSLVVTTGGAGTVTTALCAGVPLIVIPNAWELPENAQRVHEAGAGLRIDPARLTPERLREAAREILADPSFRSNAERVGKELEDLGGVRKAADLIELAAPRSAGRASGNWNASSDRRAPLGS